MKRFLAQLARPISTPVRQLSIASVRDCAAQATTTTVGGDDGRDLLATAALLFATEATRLEANLILMKFVREVPKHAPGEDLATLCRFLLLTQAALRRARRFKILEEVSSSAADLHSTPAAARAR